MLLLDLCYRTGCKLTLKSADTLAEALGVLHLRGFVWYGCGPEPQNEVLYALAKNSSSSLSELVLP